MAQSRITPLNQRLRYYAGVAFLLVVIYLLLFPHSMQDHFSRPARWGDIVVPTSFTLFFALKAFRRQAYANLQFCLTVVGFLIAHLLMCAGIMWLFPGWRVGWFWLMFVVEAPVLAVALDRLFDDLRSRSTVLGRFR